MMFAVFVSPNAKLTDGSQLDLDGCPVRLKVNPRARRVSLRLDVVRREVVATAPTVRRLKDAAAFAGQRRAWIAAQLAALPDAARLAPGETIEVLGRPCRLVSTARRADAGLAEDADGLRLSAQGEGAIFALRAGRLLRAHALSVMRERTAHHAAALGCPAPAVAVTDTRSRWGSCKPAAAGAAACGTVRYSWRLVLAPWFVADYVAAHECAHLKEANHGPKFWALVRQQVGPERAARAWLRAHGSRLHAVGRDRASAQ